MAIMLLASASPAFAAGTGGSLPTPTQLGGDQQSVLDAANQIITLLNAFGFQYLQGIAVVIIVVLVVIGAVKASRAKNTTALWTEVGFGFVAIILVLNPTLLIAGALYFGNLFRGGTTGTGS